MRVSLYVQANLKDVEEGHRGMRGMNGHFGKEQETDLGQAIVGIVMSFESLYAQCYSAEELNAQMDKAAEWLKANRFEEVKE